MRYGPKNLVLGRTGGRIIESEIKVSLQGLFIDFLSEELSLEHVGLLRPVRMN